MSQTETQHEVPFSGHPHQARNILHEPVFGVHTHQGAPKDAQTAQRIERRLLQLGIPPHIRGFSYIREAVRLLMEDEEMIFGITKVLYPDVARLCGTTSTRVERAIRHAIEISWSREGAIADALFINRKDKPTNAEFLAFLSRSISLE